MNSDMEITFYNVIVKCYLHFFTIKGETMSKLKLETLQDVFDCYGENNLVPIDFIKQIQSGSILFLERI